MRIRCSILIIMLTAAASLVLMAGAARAVEPPAAGDTIVLTDGRTLVAPILKETTDSVWLDLGHDVLEIPRTRIESIVRMEQTDVASEDAGTVSLYRVARGLAERTPREQAKRFGEAVIKVST
ncbi:MAG: hypothetical protein VYC34_08385, partial [Planctomycetota bacterium]|nr:hypothetical protein [Planctomycetota bacterium]